MDVQNLALKDRACDATARIPTSRWPFYGTTLSEVVAAGGGASAVTFEAERDVLFVDMSVRAFYVDAGGDEVEVATRVSIDYCNTVYAEETNGKQWAYCCSGKGPMLLGVRESKKLKINVTFTPVAGEDITVEVSLNGYQGNGCCN